MNKNKFDETVLGILDECKQLLVTKGQDYSSDSDRLSHFKEAEKFTGLSQWDVWRVLFFKHIQSVRVYFIGNRQKLNEDIKHRIRDSINYLILLEAMLVEEEGVDKQDVKTSDKAEESHQKRLDWVFKQLRGSGCYENITDEELKKKLREWPKEDCYTTS